MAKILSKSQGLFRQGQDFCLPKIDSIKEFKLEYTRLTKKGSPF